MLLQGQLAPLCLEGKNSFVTLSDAVPELRDNFQYTEHQCPQRAGNHRGVLKSAAAVGLAARGALSTLPGFGEQISHEHAQLCAKLFTTTNATRVSVRSKRVTYC